MKNLFISFFLFLSIGIAAQNPEPMEIDCNPLWQQNIMGSYIGSMGMYIGDYNNNGREEMILGNEHVFNIFEYIPEYDSYEVIWGSREYDELQKLIIADADNDGNEEIFVYYDRYHIELYDLTSLQLKASFNTETSFWFYSDNMFIADADNDGFNELVIIANNKAEFYRLINGTCNKVFEMSEDCYNAKCGDIDGDSLNEMVFDNGNVYKIENGQPSLIWIIPHGDYHGFIELADIDNDGMNEIFFENFSLYVYDGDTRTIKWQKFGIDPVAFTVTNIDSVGLPEILYIQCDWGNVYCLESLDGSVRWSVNKEEYGGSNIVVGDPDGDGNLEMIYGSEGYSFADRDHLYIVQLHDLSREYATIYEFGHYNIIRIADIDNDGRNELITISQWTESVGPGIISVYDAETKLLEWRSNITTIPINNSHGMVTMETADVNNDGDVEIVIPCSNDGDPALVYINGRTHEVEIVKTWYMNSSQASPHDMAIDDLNNDGILEIITVIQDTLCIINSQTFQRDLITHQFGGFHSPVTGNVDNDPNVELIYIKEYLYVMDGVTGETWFVNSPYLDNCFLFDYNDDGISDIIMSSIQGSVSWVNGITRQEEFIVNLDFMSDMRFADLFGDSEPEIIYLSGNELYVTGLDGTTLFSEVIDQMDSYVLNSEITDYNNDGHIEIFFGARYYVQQWDVGCYSCENFHSNHEIHNTSCYTSNGSAEIFPYGGLEPYSFLWTSGDTTSYINEKPAGIYYVTITDKKNCSISAVIEIGSQAFFVNSVITTPDFSTTTTCEGSVEFHTTGGIPPYDILIDGQWFNLSDSTLAGLCEGYYEVTLKDANGCNTNADFTIESVLGYPETEASLQFNILPNPASISVWLQTGQVIKSGTFATISTMQGVALKSIEITSQRTLFDLSDFSEGMYLLTFISPDGKYTKKLIIE